MDSKFSKLNSTEPEEIDTIENGINTPIRNPLAPIPATPATLSTAPQRIFEAVPMDSRLYDIYNNTEIIKAKLDMIEKILKISCMAGVLFAIAFFAIV